MGKHGLMRLSNGDWNDDIVVGHVPTGVGRTRFASRAKAC